MRNIILIGMPASGKSTAGVVLAKVLGCDFIDTDLLVQNREGRRLEELIREKGIERFLDIDLSGASNPSSEGARGDGLSLC